MMNGEAVRPKMTLNVLLHLMPMTVLDERF